MPAFAVAFSSANSVGFLGMIGTGWIARCGADSAVFSRDQRLVIERFVRRISPELATDALVHVFGKCFGQSIGQRLEQDRMIVVVVAPRSASTDSSMPMPAVTAKAPIQSRAPDVLARRNRPGRRFGRSAGLSACWRRKCSSGQRIAAILVVEQHNIVALLRGRPESDDRACGQPLFRR